MKRLLSFACIAAVYAFALMLRADDTSLTWQQEAVTQLDLDEYDAAEKTAKLNKRSDRTQAKIILMAVGFKKWDEEQDKSGLIDGKTLYKQLADDVSMKDVPLLNEIRDLGGKQLTVFSAELLEDAVGKVKTIADVDQAVTALGELPPEQAPAVIHALGTWLAAQREQVKQGGRLDTETQAVFTNAVLIETLFDHIQTEPDTKQKAMDMLPGKIRRILSSATDTYTAAECLVLIEAPALPYVQENMSRLGPDGTTLEQDIRIAVSTREIRHPGSTWHSAKP